MPVIPIRDLARRTREVVDEVERSGKVAIVTRRGRPSVAVIPLDEAALEDFVLSTSLDYLTALRDAEEDLASGTTKPLHELADEAAARRKPRQRSASTASSSSRR
jgi:prevent-host-death family protein